MNAKSLIRHASTTLWLAAALVGPLPWVLLATIWLTDLLGSPGFAIGFIGAPVLWAVLSLLGLWAKPRWLAGAVASVGCVLFML